MIEQWAQIPGFPGYEVSDAGRVKSLPRPVLKYNPKVNAVITHQRAGRVMRAARSRGYPRVNLCIAGKPQKVYVHRLVMLAFVGPSVMDVRHLNGKRDDPRLCNLAYGTPSENAEDARQHGTLPIGARHGRCKLTEEKVRQIRAIPIPWKHGTIARLAREFGVSIYAIWQIKAGIGWTHVP